MATADPRHAYVRFYLSALDDLERVIAALAGTHAAARDAVRDYDDVLRDVPDAGSLAPAAVLSTSALWRPRDPAQLASLTDVYEVVGLRPATVQVSAPVVVQTLPPGEEVTV